MQMKTNLTQWAINSAVAALVLAILVPAVHAAMLPGAIGNDGSDAFDGSITATGNYENDVRVPSNVINGNGLSGAGHDVTGAGHWLSDSWQNRPWIIIDLGQSYVLSEIYFYNYNDGGFNTDRGVATAHIYYHDGATQPNANNTNLNALNFDATGWSLFSASHGFTEADPTDPFGVSDVIDLSGTTARFIALDITANHGSEAGYTGISEMQFFAVPEPASMVLLASGLLMVFRRTR